MQKTLMIIIEFINDWGVLLCSIITIAIACYLTANFFLSRCKFNQSKNKLNDFSENDEKYSKKEALDKKLLDKKVDALIDDFTEHEKLSHDEVKKAIIRKYMRDAYPNKQQDYFDDEILKKIQEDNYIRLINKDRISLRRLASLHKRKIIINLHSLNDKKYNKILNDIEQYDSETKKSNVSLDKKNLKKGYNKHYN